MLKKIMNRAWAIAKKAVEKFGGKSKEYFSIALSLAWKEVKEMTIELIGTEKQAKWATDIIERIAAVQEQMKVDYTAEIEKRAAKSSKIAEKKEQFLTQGIAFIETLTCLPAFKNRADMYIHHFGFVKTEADAYKVIPQIFTYSKNTLTEGLEIDAQVEATLVRTYNFVWSKLSI